MTPHDDDDLDPMDLLGADRAARRHNWLYLLAAVPVLLIVAVIVLVMRMI